MQEHIEELLREALRRLEEEQQLRIAGWDKARLVRPKDPSHGNWSSNVAMLLARGNHCDPRELATRIIATLPDSPQLKRVEAAGPGFINFFLNPGGRGEVVRTILAAGEAYGTNSSAAGTALVEFVSTNPTGPLHVGHGRGAAYGDSVARLLEAAGFRVEREFYVNDAGRQMDILVLSTWWRYLELCGIRLPQPAAAYRGEYLLDIARTLREQGERWLHPSETLLEGFPEDETTPGATETHMDSLIERAKTLLGEEDWRLILDTTLERILGDIHRQLEAFGVHYDRWFSERSLGESAGENRIEQTINALQERGLMEKRDGALWFLARRLGDDKDRVVVRADGRPTYFAADIAYHRDKFERRYDLLINVWGADHHGYVARLQKALGGLGLPVERLEIRLVQLVTLSRGGKQLPMSTRSGSFLPLEELCREVGADAARFFYLMYKADQRMDFDLQLAGAKDRTNPVYYVQYAHARIHSVLRKAAQQNLSLDQRQGLDQLPLLEEKAEQLLFTQLERYPGIVQQAARERAPHLLARYLYDLAAAFHAYYNEHRVLVSDTRLRNARAALSGAVRQVLRNGLGLLGVSAPERM